VGEAGLDAIGPYNMQRAEGGIATWSHVGLNQRYVVEATISALRWKGHATIDGPKREGDQASAVLTLKVRDRFFIGRLLAEDGTPVGHARLETTITIRSDVAAGTSGNPATTDAAGRFRVIFEDETRLGEPNLDMYMIVTESIEQGRGRSPPPARAARFVIRSKPVLGDNDLGDAMFKEPPLVASGIVVDEFGQPVAGASIRVTIPRATLAATTPLDPRHWESFPWWTRSGLDGRFELRGILETRQIAIEAEREGFGPVESDPVQPGAKELRLVMKRN
jgi:hypothetical protein